MERTARVLSGSIASALQLLVAMALQIVLMPLILRLAGQEVLGVYAILLQVIGYLALFDLGLYTALTRSLSQATDQPARFAALLRAGVLFLSISGAIYAAAGAGLALALPGLFHLSGALAGQARLALLILAGWGLLRFPLGLFGTALLSIQDLTWPPLLALAANALRMVLAILAVLGGWGIIGLSVASIVGEAALYGILALRFMRLRPGLFQLRGRLDRPLLIEQLRFGLRAFWGNLAGRVVFFSDSLVVGNLYGAAMTSIYYNTQMPISVAYSLVYHLADNASPGINELWARGDREKLRDIFLRLQRLTLLAVAPIVIGGLFYLRAVIGTWVGPAQFGGQLMTLWLVLFAALATARNVPQVFLYAIGDLRRWSQIVAFEAAGNLALSFWWGSRLGLHGVALATLVAALPTAAYLQWRVSRDLRITWRDWAVATLLPALGAALPTTAVAALLSSLAQPAGWGALALHAGALAAVHAGSVYALGLSRADRLAARQIIRRGRNG